MDSGARRRQVCRPATLFLSWCYGAEDSQTRPPPKDSIWKAIQAVHVVLPMPTILLLATIQPIYVSAIPDRRPARMRDLPIEEVDGEISRKWTERYQNVDDQDGRPLSLASKVNPSTSTFLMSSI